jgi:hypothetical protein
MSLSKEMLTKLDAGEYDLATVNGSPAKWNAEEQKFMNVKMAVGTYDFGADDLSDDDVALYRQI